MPVEINKKDAKRYHITVSSKIESILKTGLDPEAKKIFGFGHPTPTFGGIYYTSEITDFPNIIKNLSSLGLLALNSLVIISFPTIHDAYVDEDDFFCLVDGKIRYSGPYEVNTRIQSNITSLWDNYIKHPYLENYLLLKNEMQAFFDKAPRNPAKGHIKTYIPPEYICLEAILQPWLDMREEKLVWKAEKGDANLTFFEKLLNMLELPVQLIDSHYPYDCALPTVGFDDQDCKDSQEFELSPY